METPTKNKQTAILYSCTDCNQYDGNINYRKKVSYHKCDNVMI